MMISSDRGDAWTAPRTITQRNAYTRGVTVLGDSIVVIALIDSIAWDRTVSSTDAGDTWTVSPAPIFTGSSDRIALSQQWLHLIYHRYLEGYSFEVFYKRSSDLGLSWSDSIALSTVDNFVSMTEWIASSAEGNVYVAWTDGKYGCVPFYGCTVLLRRSTDGGNTWLDEQILSDFLARESAHIDECDQDVAAAWEFGNNATGIHVEARVSFDRGAQWCPVVDLTPVADPTFLALWPWISIGPRFVAVAWEQRDTLGSPFQIWCRVGLLPLVGVKDEPSSNLEGDQLDGAFPNPFNVSTRIRYNLQTRGNVLVRMFNILGEEITVLVNEHQETGWHEVVWDSQEVASGVYFYRLTTGSYTATGKVLLLH
jgi:hypothetical protein